MVSTLATISALLLTCYALGVLYALCSPSRQPDPQRGVAVGCLWIVLAGIIAMGLALGLAVGYHLAALVYVITAACAYPAALLAANLAWRFWTQLQQRPADKAPGGRDERPGDTGVTA